MTMKTAISIPDRLFKKADQIAHSLGLSRSELYSRAVESFVESHDSSRIRAALDQLYAEQSSGLDPVLGTLQAAALSKEEW